MLDFISLPHFSMALSEQQQRALDLAIDGKSLFITGPGGVGKSYLISRIVSELSLTDHVKITASTGVAAVNIGGMTLHSFIGAGLCEGPASEIVDKIMKNKKAVNRWRSTDVLIIDEVSMIDGDLFDKAEHAARQVRKNPAVFGGIQVILCGDFFQLPPVKKGEVKFVFETDAWTKLAPVSVQLSVPFRQKDERFFWCLNRIRDGSFTDDDVKMLTARVGAVLENTKGILPTKLYSVNAHVDAVNDKFLSELPGTPRTYEMKTSFLKQGQTVDTNTIDRAIEAIKKGCQAPEVLSLKVGAQVMLLKNLDVAAGLCNGSRGVVIGFDDEGVKVSFLDVPMPVTVTKHQWRSEMDYGVISVIQLPLKLAWSLTIHKAQGASLDLVDVNLDKVFAEGQVYVALSRARTVEGLTLSAFNPSSVKTNKRVKKFYAELTAQ